MGFLDNSGDIILDAVLTDTGRKRLAAGDGSFRIVKFALGDDEIDYALYRNSNSVEGRHPSGSAYYDLNILQTPVLEAFTNNTSMMNTKLVSYTRGDILYLPVIKVNNLLSPTIDETIYKVNVPAGGYIITADYTTSNRTTYANETASPLYTSAGVVRGNQNTATDGQYIALDQGLDTTNLSIAELPTGDPLRETQYLIEMDNRLGQVLSMDGSTVARPAFVDDDDIASYYISLNSNSQYFATPDGTAVQAPTFTTSDNIADPNDDSSVIGSSQGGRYGTRLVFRILASQDIATSNTLFEQLGGITATNYLGAGTGVTFRYIESMIRVTGFTTGYRVEIPVRYLKKV
jgi:hypothetical protein